MVYLDRITADLSHGSRDYLNALLAIVNGDRVGGANADAIRNALVAARADPVRFGSNVVDLI